MSDVKHRTTLFGIAITAALLMSGCASGDATTAPEEPAESAPAEVTEELLTEAEALAIWQERQDEVKASLPADSTRDEVPTGPEIYPCSTDPELFHFDGNSSFNVRPGVGAKTVIDGAAASFEGNASWTVEQFSAPNRDSIGYYYILRHEDGTQSTVISILEDTVPDGVVAVSTISPCFAAE